jgi:hypothetical protein
MAKRNRRDRRQGQLSRAVLALDRSALQAFAVTSPALVAHELAKACSDPEADSARAASTQELIAELAGSMRRSGHLKAALHLAASGAHRSSRLRLEQALAAFACGDDTQAAEVAGSDSKVEAIVGVLLDAARGSPPRAFSSDDSPLVHALRAVAESVSHAVRGQPEQAKAALGRLAAEHRGAMLVREIEAAIELAFETEEKARNGLQHIVQAPVLRPFAEARAAAVMEATAVHPDLASEPVVRRALSPQQLKLLRQQAAAARLGTSAANGGDAASANEAVIGMWFEFLNAGGAETLPEASLGAAYVYEGFAWMDRDARRAEQAFDRAIAHGGDLVDALRGKLLLACMGRPCPDCGERHGSAPEEVAAAAERLARSLQKVPRATAMAKVVWLLAAEAWVDAGEKEAALAAITSARHAEGPSMQKALDSLEAEADDCDKPDWMSLPEDRAGSLLGAFLRMADLPNDVRERLSPSQVRELEAQLMEVLVTSNVDEMARFISNVERWTRVPARGKARLKAAVLSKSFSKDMSR